MIVSEAVAARFFPGESPSATASASATCSAEIVGVVGDIRRASLTDDPRADLYFPFERVMSPSTTLFIRTTRRSARSRCPRVRAAVRRLEPHAVLYETRTLAQSPRSPRR